MATQTKTKKITHVQHQKKVLESNQQLIRTVLGLSTNEYNEIIFDYGLMFLDMFYDRSSQAQAEWIEKMSKQPQYQFWKWWNSEWRMTEYILLRVLKSDRLPLTKHVWLTTMTEMVHDGTTEKSFINFLKYNKANA